MDNEPSGADGMTAGDRTVPKQTEWRKYSKTLIEELKRKLEDRRARTLELLSENRDLVAFQEIDTESDGLDDTSTNVTLKHELPQEQHGLTEHLLAMYEASSMTESDYCDELDSKLSDCPYSVDVVRCEGECTHSSYSTTTSASCDSLISETEDGGLDFGVPVINKADDVYNIKEKASVEKLPLINQNPDAGDTCDVIGDHIQGIFGDVVGEMTAVSPRVTFVDQIFTRDIINSSLFSDVNTQDSSLEPYGELSVRLTESFTNLLGDSIPDDPPNNQLVGNGDTADTKKDDTMYGEKTKEYATKEVFENFNDESEVKSKRLNNTCPIEGTSRSGDVSDTQLMCKPVDVAEEAEINDQLSTFKTKDRFSNIKKCRFHDEIEVEDNSAKSDGKHLFKEADHANRRTGDIFQSESAPLNSGTVDDSVLDCFEKINKTIEEKRTDKEDGESMANLLEVCDKQLNLKGTSSTDTHGNFQTEVTGTSFADKLSKDVIYSSKVTLEEIFGILKNNSFLNSDVDKDITALLETCVAGITAFQNISSNSGYPSVSRDGWPAVLSSAETSHLLSHFTSDCDPIVRKRHLNACLEKAQLANALQKKIGRMNNRVENIAAERAYEKAVSDFEEIMSEFFKTYASSTDDPPIQESKCHSPTRSKLPTNKITEKKTLSRSNTFVIDKAKSRSPTRATTSKQFLKPERAKIPITKNYKTEHSENPTCVDAARDIPVTTSPTFFILQERNSLFPTKEIEKKRHKKPSRKTDKVKLLSRSQRTRDSGTFIIHSSHRDSNTSSETETSDSATENHETDTCQYTSSMLTQLLDYDSQEDEVTTKENDNEVYCSDTSGVFSRTADRDTLNELELTAEKTTKIDISEAGLGVGKMELEIKDPDEGKGGILIQKDIQIEEDEQINYESDFNAESISEIIQIEEDPDVKEEGCHFELEQSSISRDALDTIDTGVSSNGRDELFDQIADGKQPAITNQSEDIAQLSENCVVSNECNVATIKSPSTIDEIDILYEFSKNLTQIPVDLSHNVKESLLDSKMNLDRPSIDPAEEYPSTSAGSSCVANSPVDGLPHVSRPSHRKWLLKADNNHNDLDDITGQFIPTVDWTSSDEDLIDDLKRDKSPSDILKMKQKEIVDEKLKQLTQISKRKRKSRSPVRYRCFSQNGANQLENLARDLGLNDMSWTVGRDLQGPTSCFANMGEISIFTAEGPSKTNDPTRPSVSQLLLARIDEESNENAAEVVDDPLDINKEESHGYQHIIQTHERSKAIRSTKEETLRIQVGFSPSRPKTLSTYSGKSPTKPISLQNVYSQPGTEIPSLTLSGEIISSVSSTSGEFILPALSNSLLLGKSETTLKTPQDELVEDNENLVCDEGLGWQSLENNDKVQNIEQILRSADDDDGLDRAKDGLPWRINDRQHSCHTGSKCVPSDPEKNKNHVASCQSLMTNENVVREVTAIESKITCSNPEIFISLSNHQCSILHEEEETDKIEYEGDIDDSKVELKTFDDNSETRKESVPCIISHEHHMETADGNCSIQHSIKTKEPSLNSCTQKNNVLQLKDIRQSDGNTSYEKDNFSSKAANENKGILEPALDDWMFLGETKNFVQHLDKSRCMNVEKNLVYKVVNPELLQLSCSPSPLKQSPSSHISQRTWKNLTREKVTETEYVPTAQVHRKLDLHRRSAQRHALRQDGLYFSHWGDDGSLKSQDSHRAVPRQSNFSIPARNDQVNAEISSERQHDSCLKTDNSTLLALCEKLTSLEQLLTIPSTVPDQRDCYRTQQSEAYKQMTSRAMVAHLDPEIIAPCPCALNAPFHSTMVCTCCRCKECRRNCATTANKLCSDVWNTSQTRAIPETPRQCSVNKSSSKATQTENCKPFNVNLINQNQSTQTKDSEASPPYLKPEDLHLLADEIKEMQNDCQLMKLSQASVGASLDRLELNIGCKLLKVAADLKTEVGDLIGQTHDHVTQVLTSQLAATMERLNQSISATMSTYQHCLTQQGIEINKLVVTLQESKSGVDKKEQNAKKGMDYDTLKMRVVELTSQRDAEKVFHKITRESLRALERDHDRLRQEYIRASYRKANLGTESGVRKRLLDLLAEKDDLPTQRNRHRHERDSCAKYKSRYMTENSKRAGDEGCSQEGDSCAKHRSGHVTENAKRAGDEGCSHEGDQTTTFKPQHQPRPYLPVKKTADDILLDSSRHQKKSSSGDKRGLTKSKQFFNAPPMSERTSHLKNYISCEVLNLMPKHSKPAAFHDLSDQHQDHQDDMYVAHEARGDNELSTISRQPTDQITIGCETSDVGNNSALVKYHEDSISSKLFSTSARKSSETADVKLHASTSVSQPESCLVTDAALSANANNVHNCVLTTEDCRSTTGGSNSNQPSSQNTKDSPGYLADKRMFDENETADHMLDHLDVGLNESKSSLVLSSDSF